MKYIFSYTLETNNKRWEKDLKKYDKDENKKREERSIHINFNKVFNQTFFLLHKSLRLFSNK